MVMDTGENERHLTKRVVTLLATRKLTEQAIIQSKAEIAAFSQASYAEALTRAITVEQARQQQLRTQAVQDQGHPTHKIFKPEANYRDEVNINGKGKQMERNDNTLDLEKCSSNEEVSSTYDSREIK